MLFFVGKDALRWVGQCVEFAAREPELSGLALRAQSFAALLTDGPPEAVQEKLKQWGVADYASIFARAIGLNAMFVQPPAFDELSDEFLHKYHRYSDQLYRCYLDSEPHYHATASNFRFDLYASGEYSRMLESEWGG
jgi:hypothetical protein